MRRLLLITGVIAASLGLSACGTSTTASINQSVASLGASAFLQVHLTGSVADAGVMRARPVLKSLSVDMRYENPSGGPLSQSSDKAHVEVVVNLRGRALADLREVGSNIYVKVDLSSLPTFPGVNITPEQIAAAQLVVGGRWFELSKSLLGAVASHSAAAPVNAPATQYVVRKVIDAIVAMIDSSPVRAIAGGYSERGTLQSVVDAISPTIAKLTHSTTGPKFVKGTYTLKLTTTGSSATDASILINAPHGTVGDARVSLSAIITLASDAISAPIGATIFTPALLQQLRSFAG